MQEPRQCGEVTEDGEPNAIPVDSALVRRRLPRGVAFARRLPASALRWLLPRWRWRRHWRNPRRRGPHGPPCRRTRPAGLSGLGASHCAPSGLCRAEVPKSPCPPALILGVALTSSLQINTFLEAPQWMGHAPLSPSAETAPLLGRRSRHRPDRGESYASCSQRYAREDAAYAHDALSCLAREIQAPRRFVQLTVVVGGAAGTRGRDPGSLAGAQAEQRLLEAELADRSRP